MKKRLIYLIFLILFSFYVDSEPNQVDCTINQECINRYGPDYVCDLSSNNFGKCVKGTTPDYCGDGICHSLQGENDITCPADCDSNFNKRVVSEKKQTDFIFYIIIGAIIVGFFILGMVLRPKK